MKKVEFVRVKSETSGFGLVKGVKYTFLDVEDIIRERIENGWSFQGYVPIVTRGIGDIEVMSLIFQKDE